MTWEELQAGGTRLERALAQCDQREWEALPLMPRWLSSTFPDLWSTGGAASRWWDERPREANRDYIYWGAFYRFRLRGRSGRPAWAIVKHGVDSPVSALSAVTDGEVTSLEPAATTST